MHVLFEDVAVDMYIFDIVDVFDIMDMYIFNIVDTDTTRECKLKHDHWS